MSANEGSAPDPIPTWDPRTGQSTGAVEASTEAVIVSAIEQAHAAAPVFSALSPQARAAHLLAIADRLERSADAIVQAAIHETGLDAERLSTETASMVRQWRFYAEICAEGSWLDATIDLPTQSAPDLRRVSVPVGVVAVFGASNFPLTYGLLGHDTASALASGSAVVAKAHPAHPRLGELLALLAAAALRDAGAPDGVFSVVCGFEAGLALVADPRVGAVAFTGSQAGGMALREASERRDVPVPVYAEMGTVNPVVVTTSRAEEDLGSILEGFAGIVRFGAGQVCTKPGLLFVPKGTGLSDRIAAIMSANAPVGWALTEGIHAAYASGVDRLVEHGATVLGKTSPHPDGWAFDAVMLEADISAIDVGSPFVEECFGPVGVIVQYEDPAEVIGALSRMQGALTAGVFCSGGDDPQLPVLVSNLTPLVGRVVVDQWPIGVATTWAQHHGGPWPATTVAHATSVGAPALHRFVRPVAFQNMPQSVLPPALQDTNPWRIPRRINGQITMPEHHEHTQG